MVWPRWPVPEQRRLGELARVNRSGAVRRRRGRPPPHPHADFREAPTPAVRSARTNPTWTPKSATRPPGCEALVRSIRGRVEAGDVEVEDISAGPMRPGAIEFGVPESESP